MRWIALIALLALAGCQTPPAPAPARHVDLTVHDRPANALSQSMVGHTCRVQFRLDALGLASSSGVTINENWVARMAVQGKVLQLTDQWIVIVESAGGKTKYLPQSVVLLVEVLD